MKSVSRTLIRLALPLLALTALSTSEITCGISNGYDRGKTAYFFSGDGSLSSFDKCASKCQSDSQCKSFAFSTTDCLLYSDKLDTNFRQQSDSPYVFYDRECRDVPVTTFTTLAPSQTPAPADSVSTPDKGAPPASQGSDGAKGGETATPPATTLTSAAQLGASLTSSMPSGTVSFTDTVITPISNSATTKSVTSKSTTSKSATSISATATAASSSANPSSAAAVVHLGASSSVLILFSLLAAMFA